MSALSPIIFPTSAPQIIQKQSDVRRLTTERPGFTLGGSWRKNPLRKNALNIWYRQAALSALVSAQNFAILEQPRAAASTRGLQTAVDAFTQELAALTPEALVARWGEEKGKEFEQLRTKAEREEIADWQRPVRAGCC